MKLKLNSPPKTLAKGDAVTLRGSTHGHHQFYAHLPKGTEGRRCRLVKILFASVPSFAVAQVLTVRLIDVKARQNQKVQP